ncbi:MAG: acyl-CoA dehydrogenase family protein, partial [Granulosicoccus sp.]
MSSPAAALPVASVTPTAVEEKADTGHSIDQIKSIVKTQLAPRANDIDQGHYPLEIMTELGKAGAFSAHLGGSQARFGDAIAAMQAISSGCGSTGFLTWCHDVCGLYMEQSENSLLHKRLPAHVSGSTFGGTALSNPMKTFAGIESMLLKAKKTSSGYIVNGSLPWVSHLDQGQYCGAIAAVEKSDGSASHEIMFLLEVDDSVTLKPCPMFSGMEGTSTKAIVLNDFELTDEFIIADPAKPFIA